MVHTDHISYFRRIPWAAPLLSDPNLEIRIPEVRRKKATGADNLFAVTLTTPDTIQNCMTTYIKPKPEDVRINELSMFFTLGSGMAGHPHILHGGIVATLLDEVMGQLQTENGLRDYLKKIDAGLISKSTPDDTVGSFTAYLNTQYLRPIRTGAEVVAVAKYVKTEGRKIWVKAEILQSVSEDDDTIAVCSTGEALFVVRKDGKARKSNI